MAYKNRTATMCIYPQIRETAINVGKRHGWPVALVIEVGKMRADGYVFYLSENGVWLTGEVPVGYIRFEGAKNVSKH